MTSLFGILVRIDMPLQVGTEMKSTRAPRMSTAVSAFVFAMNMITSLSISLYRIAKD
jgi:hypothetical protein